MEYVVGTLVHLFDAKLHVLLLQIDAILILSLYPRFLLQMLLENLKLRLYLRQGICVQKLDVFALHHFDLLLNSLLVLLWFVFFR